MNAPNRPKAIDVGDLTEVVLSAVSRALDERPAAQQALIPHPPRIICGIIIDPGELPRTITPQ
jgi:hypothetical protein